MSSARTVVVGGGIVGLCCAFHLQERGREVVLVAPEDHGGASTGNAGALAVTECVPASLPGLWRRVPGWALDPLGPLHVRPGQLPRLLPWILRFLRAGDLGRVREISDSLAALNALVLSETEALLGRLGLGERLHRTGSLVLYRDAAERDRDALEWQLKREHGVRLEMVDRAAIEELEPGVGPQMTAGVLQPDWAHVSDPADVVARLRRLLVERGVEMITTPARSVVRREGAARGVTLADGRTVEAGSVVLAAGAWTPALSPDRLPVESERGYNTTLPVPRVEVRRQIIFGAEKFVATPLDVGLRIGGAAEFAGLEAAPNYRRSDALLTKARRMLPGLSDEGASRWMGHRPATPDSLPVLGPSPSTPGLYYACGHGHLGLTQGAPSGRLIADLITGVAPPVDLRPFSAARFD